MNVNLISFISYINFYDVYKYYIRIGGFVSGFDIDFII